MNLVIHDLSAEEWESIKDKYSGWNVICNNGNIKPCVGCFGCWVKTPGQCVIKDGYERIGRLYSQAEKIDIISRLTFGGCSSFVKNVLDKSINWVLPYFEIRNDEMHHVKRYNHVFELNCHFYGDGITAEDEEAARKYVKAVCVNFGAELKNVDFNVIKGSPLVRKEKINKTNGNKTLLINCSLKAGDSNSRIFLDTLNRNMNGEAVIVNIGEYLRRFDELTSVVDGADKLVVAMPLFVDGVPSVAVRFMEHLYIQNSASNKKVYAIVNQGFYESRQSCNALAIAKNWAEKTGFDYSGGVAVGAGEMIGMLVHNGISENGPIKSTIVALKQMAKAVEHGDKFEDIYVEPTRFSRRMYMFIANRTWPRSAKAFGVRKKELLKCDNEDIK